MVPRRYRGLRSRDPRSRPARHGRARGSELLARLRSIVRRSAGHASSVITAGDLRLDERQMKLSVRGAPIALSALEYRLVAYLLRNRGRVVPQHELDENVYGHGEEHESNALEV